MAGLPNGVHLKFINKQDTRSKTITNFETGYKEKSRDLAHLPLHAKETQNDFLAAIVFSIARKDPKERKGGY